MGNDEWMIVGRVAGPFGVRGEMKVEPYTDDPERFGALKHVYLDASRRRYPVERSRKHKNLVVLKLEGVDSPEAVRALAAPEIAIPRAEAVPLAQGQYYLEDILGVRVTTSEGREIGTVTDVLRTGSNDVFVVGQGSSAVLVPVIRDAIRELDLVRRRVVVDEWILKPYL
ncbi:MAG: ribosome maturation factor RimM [Chloroflexota bacterium]